MRPALGMEGEKPAIITVAGMPEKPKTPSSSTKKATVGVVIGLTSLAVVATIVVLSVHFGAKLTRDTYKETRQIFHKADGKTVEEVSIVTATDVTIKVPNEMETVYDYMNGLSVSRYMNKETKKMTDCFATPMNETIPPSRNPEDYKNEEIWLASRNSTGASSHHKWESTSVLVPLHMVSEKVREMCWDANIYWMTSTAASHKQKRQEPDYSKYSDYKEYDCKTEVYEYCYYSRYCCPACYYLYIKYCDYYGYKHAFYHDFKYDCYICY